MSLREDLRTIGLRLVATAEGCRCEHCKALDTQFDVDALAMGETQSYAVSHRGCTDDRWQTITIRKTTDSGSQDSQYRKILDGRSRADVYVQGYPSGVAWASHENVRAALIAELVCTHRPVYRGGDGQTFVVLCAKCCPGLVYTPRRAVTD